MISLLIIIGLGGLIISIAAYKTTAIKDNNPYQSK